MAEELGKIYKGRSTTLELHVPKLESSSQDTSASSEEADVVVRRSPGANFYHPTKLDLPCLVVEVGYSPHGKDLPRLAEIYIVDSSHSIRCVIGFDVPYSSSEDTKLDTTAWNEATVSVWRPGMDGEVGICECTVDRALFRGASGEACEDDLKLNLADIIPHSVIVHALSQPCASPNSTIAISLGALTSYLNAAQSDHAAASESFASIASSSAPRRFRKRKRTPGEELSDSREAEYLQREEREQEKISRVDAEWRLISRSTIDGDDAESTARRRSLHRRDGGRAVGHASGS